MDKQALETKLHFSQPIRQIIMMMLAIGLASIGLFMALNDVIAVVTANLYLNGFIFFVFCVGIISCFVQVFQLIYSVRWIENFARDPGHSSRPPQILAPLATLLRSRGSRMQIAASSTRSIWILSRHVLKKRVRLPAILSTCLSFLVYWAHFMGWQQRSHPLSKPFDHLPQKMGKVGLRCSTD